MISLREFAKMKSELDFHCETLQQGCVKSRNKSQVSIFLAYSRVPVGDAKREIDDREFFNLKCGVNEKISVGISVIRF